MRKFLLMLILLAGLLALAVPVAAQNTVPRFDATNCPFTAPEGTDPTCGYVTVPEDRSNPNGSTIRLAVAVFASDNPNPQPDPVIYLDGGPGGHTLETIQLSFSSLVEPFLPNHDVIVFDQRGVGLSQPSLDCPETVTLTYQTIDQNIPVDEDIQRYVQAVEDCGARLTRQGINLQAYTSAASAADVNDIRQVLGYDQLNLYGISYGTRLALTIMRDFPQTVRSTIIDSVVPLQSSGFYPGQTAERALNEVFNACAADSACDSLYPNLKTVFYNTVDQLDATPAILTIPNPQGGGTINAVVNGADYVGLVFQSMYISSLIEQLPDAMYAASQGDLSFFSNVLLLQLVQLNLISEGMYYAVNCNEEYSFDTADTIQADLQSLPKELVGFAREGLIDPAALQLCQALGARTPDPIENQPVVSDIPTLVMSGQFDPITPPDYGREAASTLSHSFFFEFPGLTHGVTPADQCPLSIALAFLDNPTTEPDSSCIANMPAPDFALSSPAANQSVSVNMVPFTDADQGFSSVQPEGWNKVTIGTFVRGQSASDQTLLQQLAIPGVSAESVLTLLKTQYGWADIPSSIGTHQANGLTWNLYQFTYLGFPADLAVAEGAGHTYLVLLLSNRNEHEGMYNAVFLPVIDAFTPGV